MPSALNLYSAVCQLYLNTPGRKQDKNTFAKKKKAGKNICATHLMDSDYYVWQASANIFCKEPNSKYLRLQGLNHNPSSFSL